MSRERREFAAPDVPYRSRAATGAKIAVALLSATVLAVAGYGWANYGDLQWALSTSAATDGATADGATDILLVGLDSRTDAQGRPLPEDVLRKLKAGQNPASLTDTLILVHVPENGRRATAFSLPRDTFATIPGHGQHKINSAYGRGKAAAAANLGGLDAQERERRSADAGRSLVTETVQRLTGTQIDHYAEVNLLGFARLTEAVGGVPVCLKRPVRDSYSGAAFAAGHQRISGADALAFVRQRHGLPRGDLDRMVRQQAFLAGLVDTATSGGLLSQPARLRELVDSARQSVVLDRNWDVLTFAQRMQGIAGGDVEFATIPIRDANYDTPDGEAVRVDPAEVSRIVQGAADGRPVPRQAGETGEQSTGERPDPSTGDGAAQSTGTASSPRSTRDDESTRSSSSADEPTGSTRSSRSSESETTTRSSTTRSSTSESSTTRSSTSESSTSRSTARTTTSEPPVEQPIAPDPITADGVNCIN
ncbi:LCP family protein [Saccharopolyspora sp. NFXS83]|uniref:LCP family protein n=1 Tax=Saccharopolyspora sp. NFXS83 TaxID=2993560 RepID=UPI00224B942F|nr:LCP family protein [Saccharopolyspora sp. NFXS83]MCX2733146.1 LCP family protein [Saccharopolyspora sp. NFXS83]